MIVVLKTVYIIPCVRLSVSRSQTQQTKQSGPKKPHLRFSYSLERDQSVRCSGFLGRDYFILYDVPYFVLRNILIYSAKQQRYNQHISFIKVIDSMNDFNSKVMIM